MHGAGLTGFSNSIFDLWDINIDIICVSEVFSLAGEVSTQGTYMNKTVCLMPGRAVTAKKYK